MAVIVGLGDSTTAGTPAFRSPLESPPDGAGDPRSQYGYWLMKDRPDWRFRNRGINGERADEILTRVPRDLIAESPDVAIVIGGINDIFQGRPIRSIVVNLEAIYALASHSGIRLILGTVLPCNRMPEG